MSGHISGVAARISREEPKALYIHFLAYSINLCLQDCAKLCKCIKDALGLVNKIYNLINTSPKCLALYNRLKLEHNQDTSSIKPLCPTRWTVRTAAINAVLKNYSLIQWTLDEIAADSTGEPAAKASGLGCLMEKFETYFGLKLSYVAFVATEQLAITLQAKDVNAHICTGAVNATKLFLKNQCDDSRLTRFFESVTSDSENSTEKPTLLRKRRAPRRLSTTT